MVEHTASELNPVELITGNLLIGGMPGSGKSVPFNLIAAHTALTDERADVEQADTDRRSAGQAEVA